MDKLLSVRIADHAAQDVERVVVGMDPGSPAGSVVIARYTVNGSVVIVVAEPEPPRLELADLLASVKRGPEPHSEREAQLPPWRGEQWRRDRRRR